MALQKMTVGESAYERSNLAPEMEAALDDDAFDAVPPKEPSLLRRIVVKVRLLPMVIFFATLTLTVRVGDIWDGVDGFLNGTLSVSGAEAQAQTQGEALSAPDLALPPGDTPPTDLAGDVSSADMAGGGEGDLAPMPAMPEEDRAAIAARMLADDPTLLTQSEIDLLQKLAERRVEIDARAREMETREAMLAAAESRIQRKVEELKALQATIESLVKTYDDQQNTKILSLVKIYENMKPKDAALIFEELEMEVLLKVAERMKERSLAPIMAKMNPQRAREITVELDQLRKLPEPAPEQASTGG
jgi:flagellar motility protein MotE (MotC chaperone)